MALAYVGEPGLPKQLTNLPLEYFKTALAADPPRTAEFSTYGGDIPGNLAARVDGWDKATAFLNATLRP